jgi:hypothetical protein
MSKKLYHNIVHENWLRAIDEISANLEEQLEEELESLEKITIDTDFKDSIQRLTIENAIRLAKIIRTTIPQFMLNFDFETIIETSDGNSPLVVLAGEFRPTFPLRPILVHSFNVHLAWIMLGEDSMFHAHCFPEIYYCIKGKAVIAKIEGENIKETLIEENYEIINPFVWHKCKQAKYIGFFGKYWDKSNYLISKINPPIDRFKNYNL